MPHDFKKFPELANSQMNEFYWESPHKQITEDFNARVIKIVDGDTIRVETDFRDFDFPVRLKDIDTKELGETGALEAALWLRDEILGKEVEILINTDQRVGKFGRLIGDVISMGQSMSQASLDRGHAIVFGVERDGAIPENETLFPSQEVKKWA